MTEKKLFDINLNLLKEYNDIKKLNPDNWDIASYLNLKYDMNAAIAFSKLYFPDFIEKDGCIILGFLYDKTTFNEWYERFNGDTTAIESMCNSYDVMDYFGLNRSQDESPDLYNQIIDEFAKILKKSWEANCKLLFPERKMIVEVYDQYNTTRITLFTEKIK